MEWEAVIGLEVHTQLLTKSKIFSGASTQYGATPNSQACAIDLGFPGILPVLNKEAVMMAIKLGLSIQADIPEQSIFARKNYFYPDLPKGYQISQYEKPIVANGHLTIQLEDGSSKKIRITRAHLEEDAGKSLHDIHASMSGIDLNRAGTPLLEIVSEPDLRSANEAVRYLKALHTLVRYLQICDGNMQEGSFRCDANVSVRPLGTTKLGTRTEIKNLNSFRFIEKAINYEIDRQITTLESGDHINQETRLYDSDKNETRTMRTKEEANDYRYFPDPDLLPIIITQEIINTTQESMPELPHQKAQRFSQQYQLSDEDIESLITDPEVAAYFEDVINLSDAPAKLVVNWMNGELAAALNKHSLSFIHSPINANRLAGLLKRIEDNTISGKIAKKVFDLMWQSQQSADEIINEHGLKQMSDSSQLEAIIDKILADNPNQIEQYQQGKDKVFGFFVGQVMKATQGKANPKDVNELLKVKLGR